MMPITRAIVEGYIEEARQKKQNRDRWVEKRLREDFPEDVEERIKRGTLQTTQLEHILSDLDSYGAVAE